MRRRRVVRSPVTAEMRAAHAAAGARYLEEQAAKPPLPETILERVRWARNRW